MCIRDSLQSNVTALDGVGPATAEQLARLGIHQVVDLLWHFPARYDDFSETRTIDRLRPGEQVTVVANLWDVRERKLGMNRSMVEGILGDSTGTLHAIWWNKWVARQLETGKSMRFSGKIDLYRGQKTIENPVFEELDDERVATGRMSPVYALTEGLTNNRLRNLTYDVVEGYARFTNDPLPAQMRDQHELADLTRALEQIHFPDSQETLLQARRRLAFKASISSISSASVYSSTGQASAHFNWLLEIRSSQKVSSSSCNSCRARPSCSCTTRRSSQAISASPISPSATTVRATMRAAACGLFTG